MSTASRFEEIADTYILQVLAVSSPELLDNTDAHTHINSDDPTDSDDSDGEPDIFKVFTAEKKKCSGKAPRLLEAVPCKSAPHKPAPKAETPKPAPQTNSSSPASPIKSAPQVNLTKPAPQYRYHSDAEDPCLLSQLIGWFWQGKLDQITPAHLCTASPSIWKDITDQLRVQWVETASYETARPQEPFLDESPPFPDATLTDQPEPVYSLPLQEVDVALGNGISKPGLLDPGSQIVIIWQDLAQEIKAQINPSLQIQMEGANSATNWTFVEMDGTTTRHVGKRLSKISNVFCQLILYVGYKVAVSYKETPRVRGKGQSVPLTPTLCAP